MSKANKRKYLIFQHHPAEHNGRFEPLLAADGVECLVVQLDQGEVIPELDGFDALWVLGGPQQVWEEEAYPWLIAEKAAIREAVSERGMAYFGLCLGHQLLADALGGEVGPADVPEVGNLSVELTNQGREDRFFAGMKPTMTCAQGHGAEVTKLPKTAEILASSPACGVQAMRVGKTALSMQFHCELTVDMINECLEIPEYKADFEAMLGKDGIVEFLDDSAGYAPEFDAAAAKLYNNWKSVCFGTD